MEVGQLTMLRQLIGQFEDLCELYGSSVSPNYFLPPPPPPPQHRRYSWCLLNLGDSTATDNCYNLIMTAGKSENLKMLDPGKPPPGKKARKERGRGKLTQTNCAENMDQSIWKEFPEDLFDAVIARLPIATFFRFQSVCKKWNSLLTSQSFSLQCAELPRTQPWFYTITHDDGNTGAMYDPASRKWHRPSTVPALTKLIVMPVASAGGLICFLDFGRRSFYVCNPLTKSVRELPSRSVKAAWSIVAVGMTLNGKSVSGGYKILFVGRNGDYEVYDSTLNNGAHPRTMPSDIKLPLALNFRSQSVSIDSTVYLIRSDPDGIVAYDMVSGSWKQFIIPTPLDLSNHTLAASRGRIMLVGLLTKNAATCVCIWELQKMTLLWKEVDRMPNIWCLDFYGKHVTMTCLGNKDLLMLSLRSGQMSRLVSYDLATREWLKLPSCAISIGRKRRWITAGTAFHPCLTAVA